MRTHLNLPPEVDGSIWHYRNLGLAHKRHHHAELELNLVTRGSGTYLLGNRRYSIRRGDLLWLFPAQEHLLFEQTPDFEMWIGVFKRRMVRRIANDAKTRILLQKEPAGEFCRRLAEHDLDRLEDLFTELCNASEQTNFLNAGLSYGLLSSWLSFERARDVPVRDVHPAVERAAHLIRDTLGNLTLDDLAHQAGLSATRLSRLFKEQTGFTIVDFRNRQRVERFLQIYGTGQRQNMLEAALEAGFGSYPQFHRVFKHVMGYSPMQYRQIRPPR
ncbi:AraC family transcriptional regulator [Pseudacidobacterium ailaaui]|jgi:AraC-like DNA-binding protein|uniref:AraC family transcriptional regulator n=1 Tax=Pseudacidobacterium ailaaui TaxID=1382359 RepID=UPI00047E9D12|nr:AraC family transcriptional regulator [Pseudacidobacterium ailaaui]